MEDPRYSKFILKDNSLRRRPKQEQRKSARRKEQERGGFYKPITTPTPPLPALLGVGRGVKSKGVKLTLGIEGGKCWFNLFFFLTRIWPYFNCQYIKLIFPKASPVTELSVLILRHNVFHPIFPPVWLKRGNEWAAAWGCGCWPRLTHHTFWQKTQFSNTIERMKEEKNNFCLTTVDTKRNNAFTLQKNRFRLYSGNTLQGKKKSVTEIV